MSGERLGGRRTTISILLVAAIAVVPGFAQEDGEVLRDLKSYGLAVASSALPGALEFEAAMQTMERPMRAYKLTFETSSPALLKSPDADKDRVAFLKNSGKADLWQRKFCSKDLIPLMLRHGLDLVSGQILDSTGEIQSLAICPRSPVEEIPLRKEVEPALEFEDGEARTWLDRPASSDGAFAVIGIKREGARYVMYLVGRDQVLQTVNLRRAGARFLVPGDSQGAYFIVRSDGLGICDARGCSRIAKPQEMPESDRDGEIAARTDERISQLESQPKIKIWRLEPVEAGGTNAMTSRTPEPVIDPARRAEIAKWFSESLPTLRAWGHILSSVQSQKKGYSNFID